jgi:5-methylcytosine-specific restriction endonuclease McrA
MYRDSATAVCGRPDCDRPMRAKGLCFSHYQASRPKHHGKRETKRKRDRRATQLRRARLRDPDAESIDRDAIGDRDLWVCGLCVKPVDNSLSYPDPWSASLDHVEPLSLGGRHVPSNVQIAHLTCNVTKGNRVLVAH